MEAGARGAAHGQPIDDLPSSLSFSERGIAEGGVVLEASREAEREIAEHIRLDIQIAGVADLRGVNRGGNAAVAVGGGRLRGGNRGALAIHGPGAYAGHAILYRRPTI